MIRFALRWLVRGAAVGYALFLFTLGGGQGFVSFCVYLFLVYLVIRAAPAVRDDFDHLRNLVGFNARSRRGEYL